MHTDIGLALGPLLGNVGAVPVYPEPPHCNQLALSDLGEHLVVRMMRKGMIVDPDHLSVRARRRALDVIDAADYPGIVSSHSWADVDSYPRIQRLGGLVGPYAGASTSFARRGGELHRQRPKGRRFAVGYGSDVGGLGAQGPPREGDDPVEYPFKSFDGSPSPSIASAAASARSTSTWTGWPTTGSIRTGSRRCARWPVAAVVREMSRGAEAYLRMWEAAIKRGKDLHEL